VEMPIHLDVCVLDTTGRTVHLQTGSQRLVRMQEAAKIGDQWWRYNSVILRPTSYEYHVSVSRHCEGSAE